MRPKTPPPAPKHLTEDSQRLWREICERYILEPHELELLTAVCDAKDRAAAARAALLKDGEYVMGQRGSLIAHPAIRVAREAQNQFRLIIGRLDLRGAK
jgi:P27 family predicted phage terminase small subunit